MHTVSISPDYRSAKQAAPRPRHRLAIQLVFGALLLSSAYAANAADASSSAKANYQRDRENCMEGHTYEDRATCLKEAGAAYEETKHGKLNDNGAQYQQNALLRCQELKDDYRTDCERRVHGEGTVTGSVEEGGILRTLTTPVPAPDQK